MLFIVYPVGVIRVKQQLCWVISASGGRGGGLTPELGGGESTYEIQTNQIPSTQI